MYNTFMNEAALTALSSFQTEQALSARHAKKAEAYLEQFLALIGRPSEQSANPGRTIKCVREYTRWLTDNGPAFKTTIQEATGIKFTERGSAYTVFWNEGMANDPDDTYLDSTICRMDSLPTGEPGRPPVIYFLWSQRFDVLPKFGVGPAKPAESEKPDREAALRELLANGGPHLPADDERVLADRREADQEPPRRFTTIVEWDEYWGPAFQVLASDEAKPTDEQKQMMRDTVPEGADANAAIAIAYRDATQRARTALLGVVHPPTGEPLTEVTDRNGDPQLAWDVPEA